MTDDKYTITWTDGLGQWIITGSFYHVIAQWEIIRGLIPAAKIVSFELN